MSRWEPARRSEIILPRAGVSRSSSAINKLSANSARSRSAETSLEDRPRVLRAAPNLRVYALPQGIRLMAPGRARVERELGERIRQIMRGDGIHRSVR